MSGGSACTSRKTAQSDNELLVRVEFRPVPRQAAPLTKNGRPIPRVTRRRPAHSASVAYAVSSTVRGLRPGCAPEKAAGPQGVEAGATALYRIAAGMSQGRQGLELKGDSTKGARAHLGNTAWTHLRMRRRFGGNPGCSMGSQRHPTAALQHPHRARLHRFDPTVHPVPPKSITSM